MGLNRNKLKRRVLTKSQKGNHVTKFEKSAINGDLKISLPIPIELETNLSILFKTDEIEELRKIMKIKELPCLPFLFGAVILGKFDIVKKLIKQGCNINQSFESLTPLMWAVKTKNLEMIDLLLSKSADVTTIDNNGDNLLFLALDCSMWDENSFMDFWSKMREIHEFRSNYNNKNNSTMLHLAVKRQWKLLTESLIDEKISVDVPNAKGVTPLIMAAARNNATLVNILINAGANVLHEDQRGCTPICFVIGNIIQKNLEPPYNTLEELTKHFKASGELSYQSYLHRRLQLIINPPNNNIVAHQHVINKLIVAIIEYIMKNLSIGIDMLLKLKIFVRLKQALDKHINYIEYLHAIISVVATILRKCNCCINTFEECSLGDAFISSGAAASCLSCLNTYKESPFLQQLLPEALLPICVACAGNSLLVRQWLETNLKQLEPFYLEFIDTALILKEDEIHIKEKLKAFELNYDELKTKIRDSSLQSNKKSNSIGPSSPKKIEPPHVGKKQAKRVRRKNRARIAKLRSADVAERRRINSSVQLLNKEQKEQEKYECDNEIVTSEKGSETIFNEEYLIKEDLEIKSDVTKSNKSQISFEDFSSNSKENMEIDSPTENLSFDSTEDFEEKFYDEVIKPDNDLIKSVNEVTNIKSEIIKPKIETTKPIESTKESSQNLNFYNSNSSYQTVNSGISTQDFSNKIDALEINMDYCLDNNMTENRKAAFAALLIKLRLKLNQIITEYESIWKREKLLDHPGYIGGSGDNVKLHPLLRGNRDEQIHNLNGFLPHIENERINCLIISFEDTVKKIEYLFSNNDLAYNDLLLGLNDLLTNHKIRRVQDYNYSNKSRGLAESKPKRNVGVIGDHLRSNSQKKSDNAFPKVNTTNDLRKYVNQDELYLREVKALPKFVSSLTEDQRIKIKKKTEDNAYHLMDSVCKICDSDTSINIDKACDIELLTQKEDDVNAESEKKMPNSHAGNHDVTVLEIPAACSSSSQQPLQAPRISRWSTTIKNLQNFLKRKLQTKGAAKEKAKSRS